MALKVVPLPTQSFRTAAIGPRSNIRNGSLTISHIGQFGDLLTNITEMSGPIWLDTFR